MDALTFFRLLLPETGFKFLAEWRSLDNGRGIFIHYPFTDLEAMADKAAALDQQNRNVYYATSAYKDVIYKTTPQGREYPAGRTQENAVSARSLWLDLDVGKADANKSYATRQEALDALGVMLKTVGMPTPMVVSSGNGLHCYWPFSNDLPKNDWNILAALFREANIACHLKIDPSRDKDIASVLRVPGTRNPKGNKIVKVVKTAEPRHSSFYFDVLRSFLGEGAFAVEAKAQPMMLLGNSLVAPVEYPPSSLNRVAEHCAAIRSFKESGAAESEPVWRLCLGVAKHCTDGEELAHKWSSADDRYDEAETQAKLDNWQTGPSTCATFRDSCSHCSGCVHSVTSPVQLGYSEIPPAPVVEPEAVAETTTPGGFVEVAALEQELPELPYGFGVLNDRLVRSVRDPDTGVVEQVDFAVPWFWGIGRHKLEDNTWGLQMRMQVKNGRYRDFDLPCEIIGDHRAQKRLLASYEVIVLEDKGVTQYLQSYSAMLRQYMDEVNTYDQYGWLPDRSGVLLGDTLITRDGMSKVRLSKRLMEVPELVPMFRVNGTKEAWVNGVDTLYNRKHAEPHQYAIVTQFGAWLCPLMESEEWNGIPLALTSKGSGYGKTTSTKIAQNAFIRSTVTTVTNCTPRALIGRASAMGSVPTLFDEITDNVVGEDLSAVLYALSNGRARIGMQSDGRERKPLPSFKQMSTITGNRNTMFQLSEAKSNPEATQMRVFEIDLHDYPVLESLRQGHPLHLEHAPIVEQLTNRVSCVLTVEYLHYIMANAPKIQEQMERWYMRIKKALGDSGGNAAKERFYARHIACSITGGLIAQHLGYIHFDMKHLLEWAIKHVGHMRRVANEYSRSMEESLSNMMSSFLGGLLVTREYESLNSHNGPVEEPILPIRGDVKARVVLGTKRERGRIFVSISAIETWCRSNALNPVEFRKELEAGGYVRNSGERLYLAKGVPQMPIGRQRCIELEYTKLQGIISDINTVVEMPSNVEPKGELA